MTDDNPKVVELLRLIQVLFETLISQGIKYCRDRGNEENKGNITQF